MISLTVPAKSDNERRFVTRLRTHNVQPADDNDSILLAKRDGRQVYAGRHGLLELTEVDEAGFDGDVIVVDPKRGVAERLIRSSSAHNTFLFTERCDQLCVMCSQPPKKTHVDRVSEFAEAARLAPYGATLGISGGEPTLYKEDLFGLIGRTHESRPDIHFHVLTNAQHFDVWDREGLASPAFANVTWGIPLYSADPGEHDLIVKKHGAFARLMESFRHLLAAGSHVELRSVPISTNVAGFSALSRFITTHLGFIDQWSIMGLENAGFARNRFDLLFDNSASALENIYAAINNAELCGVRCALFNFPLCNLDPAFRHYAVASISDWKRRFPDGCNICREKARCSGYFEWHPESLQVSKPL